MPRTLQSNKSMTLTKTAGKPVANARGMTRDEMDALHEQQEREMVMGKQRKRKRS